MSPLILQTGKAVLREGSQNMRDVLGRELEATSDASFLPAFVEHPHHGPAGAVGILELVKEGHWQRELHREGMIVQIAFDRVVIGRVAVLALENADDLPIVERRLELLEVEQIGRDDFGEVVLRGVGRGAPVHQAEHTLFEEATGFLPDGGAIQVICMTTCNYRLVDEHDRANDLVVVLNRIGKAQRQLGEILRLGNHRDCAHAHQAKD